MKLHCLGYPFSETTPQWEHCAFTQRTKDFCTMMTRAGMDVRLYAGENNDAEITEHIPIVTAAERRSWWPDYTPETDVFNSFDPSDLPWRTFNARAAAAIHERADKNDILCMTMGTSHRPIAEALPDLFHVETGIGYSGVWAPFRVYESHAWQNYLTGKYGPDDDAKFYHCVLPRAYDVDDYPAGLGNGGYYLFLGRLTERKGPRIAALACERIGAKLVVAGQGDFDALDLPGDVTYVGTVRGDAKAALLGSAIATFCPSIYLEPFCGVSVETQLTGTPVIASDWGGLVENVSEGSGFLCDTLAEFADAAELAPTLDRDAIRKKAVEKWSTDALGPKYARYFTRLQTLSGAGWYS